MPRKQLSAYRLSSSQEVSLVMIRYNILASIITISLTHAPSTVFSTIQLVLEFHIGGTGVSLMWYWSVTYVVLEYMINYYFPHI